MSVTTFTTVNGRILRQNKDGVVHNFVSDPLGSVVMVRDTSGNTVYEAEYDPYGNVQSETGTNPSSLGYVGTLGYIKDSATSMYVRARYLLSNLGRWLTKDPLWPDEPGYVYVDAAPSMSVDPSGAKPISSVCPPPPIPPGPVTCSPAWNQFVYAYCNCNRSDPNARRMCNFYATSYYSACRKPKPKPGRGGRFEFAPPPGQVGDVTPKPSPSPLCPVPPGKPDPNACREKAAEHLNSLPADRLYQIGISGLFLSICYQCCAETNPTGSCRANCDDATRAFIIVQSWAIGSNAGGRGIPWK